jgi:hypothetical protein
MRFFLLQVLTLVILGITLVAAARAQPKPYLEPVQAGTEVELHDRTYLSYPFGAGATPSELALKERAKYEVFLVRRRPCSLPRRLIARADLPALCPSADFLRVPGAGHARLLPVLGTRTLPQDLSESPRPAPRPGQDVARSFVHKVTNSCQWIMVNPFDPN